MQALPVLEIIPPHLTFDDRLTISGTKRHVELLTYGGGHTPSDAMLYLPEDRVLFTGDLLCVQAHPMLTQGDPHEWLRILDRIEQLDFEIAVPGHGPVGT